MDWGLIVKVIVVGNCDIHVKDFVQKRNKMRQNFIKILDEICPFFMAGTKVNEIQPVFLKISKTNQHN